MIVAAHSAEIFLSCAHLRAAFGPLAFWESHGVNYLNSWILLCLSDSPSALWGAEVGDSVLCSLPLNNFEWWYFEQTLVKCPENLFVYDDSYAPTLAVCLLLILSWQKEPKVHPRIPYWQRIASVWDLHCVWCRWHLWTWNVWFFSLNVPECCYLDVNWSTRKFKQLTQEPVAEEEPNEVFEILYLAT